MAKKQTKPPQLPNREQRLEMLRVIYTSRKIDDKEIMGKRQNRAFFQINGAGHEGVLAAAALVAKAGHDWFFLYYRDRALAYGLGYTAKEMFLGSVGAIDDPASGGRQMPSHWGHKGLNIFTTSSPTGSHLLQAVGAAEGILRAEKLKLSKQMGINKDEVIFATTGDGACSEGEFWEAISNAVNLKVPVVFLVEDNEYARAIGLVTNIRKDGVPIGSLPDGEMWFHHDGCRIEAPY